MAGAPLAGHHRPRGSDWRLSATASEPTEGRPKRAVFEVYRPSGPQRRHERLWPQDRQQSLQVIREHMPTHLGAYTRERLGEEVGRAHPRLQRPERVLYGLPMQSHRLWCIVQPSLRCIKHSLMLSASNASLHARSALRLHLTTGACRAPIDVEYPCALRSPISPDKPLARRTQVFI